MVIITHSSLAIKNQYHSPSGTHNRTSRWHQHLKIALSRFGTSKMKRRRWIMSSMTIQRVWSGITTESSWDVSLKIKWCIFTTQEFSENLLSLKQAMMGQDHKKWSGLEIVDKSSLWAIVLMAKADSILSSIWDIYQMVHSWPKSWKAVVAHVKFTTTQPLLFSSSSIREMTLWTISIIMTEVNRTCSLPMTRVFLSWSSWTLSSHQTSSLS